MHILAGGAQVPCNRLVALTSGGQDERFLFRNAVVRVISFLRDVVHLMIPR